MPFEITNQGDYLFTRLFGIMTAAELHKIVIEVEILEDSIPTAMDRITDITLVERFEVGFAAVEILASRRRARKFSRRIKCAIVVQDSVQFGLARMFQTLNDNPLIEVRIMRSVDEALGWFADKAQKEPGDEDIVDN